MWGHAGARRVRGVASIDEARACARGSRRAAGQQLLPRCDRDVRAAAIA